MPISTSSGASARSSGTDPDVSGGPIVGIDVGGTKILAVAIEPDRPGTPLVEHWAPTPTDADDVLDAIVECARAVGVDRRLGVGLAGLVGADGVLRAAPNLRCMVGVPVVGPLTAALAVDPPVVDNDANCALRAELAIGAASGVDDVVLVTLGTGIGGAVAMDGRVRPGAHGFAGEPGHMLVDPDGPPCPCGRRGCWERYASGAGLAALAAAAGMAGLRGEDVVNLVRDGDAAACAVLDRFAWWVACGLASIADLLDPALLVIGGGLSATADLWLDAVCTSFVEQTLGGRDRRTRIEVARTGPAAGAIGAALRVLEAAGPEW